MLHHRTENPRISVEHIVDKIDNERPPYYPGTTILNYDWPGFWLKTYDEVVMEFAPLIFPSEQTNA